MRNKWQSTCNKTLKEGVSAGKCGKKRTISKHSQEQTAVSPRTIKITDKTNWGRKFDSTTNARGYFVPSAQRTQFSRITARYASLLSSEVSEYFRVIKITKLTGGVIILGSTPRKTYHLIVHFDRFPVVNKTWGIGTVALGDSVSHSRVEINQERISQKLIHWSVLVHMQVINRLKI